MGFKKVLADIVDSRLIEKVHFLKGFVNVTVAQKREEEKQRGTESRPWGAVIRVEELSTWTKNKHTNPKHYEYALGADDGKCFNRKMSGGRKEQHKNGLEATGSSKKAADSSLYRKMRESEADTLKGLCSSKPLDAG